tara:strand:- start:220 stop:438 length:219 start_codon:yes stop_codon:yes gene_type:complete
MSEGILFIIGLLIGSVSGIVTMALLGVRRYNNMEGEIQDLRVQRQLLKEELVKVTKKGKQFLKGKPKPRKSR